MGRLFPKNRDIYRGFAKKAFQIVKFCPKIANFAPGQGINREFALLRAIPLVPSSYGQNREMQKIIREDQGIRSSGERTIRSSDEVGELSLSVTPLPCYDSLPLRLSFANSLLKSLIASSHLLIAGFPNHSALHHEIDHLQCADILQRITGCSDDIRELSDIE